MTQPQDVDVVILGGGINGAGLFRDLCEQGIKTLLVEKTDYGSGTSAAPSRLIHGGIKYLETGEFSLVAQSTQERNLLLRNAPHLVHPLPTVVPIFSWTKGVGAALRTLVGSTRAPRSRGAIIIKLGLMMYDFYSRKTRVMPNHRLWKRAEALRKLPSLTPRIVAAGTYYDATVTAPERLVWELVADGLRANPEAVALNATTLVGQEGGVLHMTDHTGTAHHIRPRITVNAAGPWIDRVNATLGTPSQFIGGTKGSHILLDHPALIRELDGRMIYFEADDGRICLVFDYLGRALVGSTDIKADDPDDVRCEDAEIGYFLDSLRALLPGLTFDRDQIVYAYSGIRPLPRSDGTAAGLISRDHSVPVIDGDPSRPFPILSLVGGKWTTFRGFAEEVADDILQRLDRPRRISTRALPIGGGRDCPKGPEADAWVANMAHSTDLTPDRCRVLLDRYGSTAEAIAEYEALGPATPLIGDPDTTTAEIEWIARNEAVTALEDVLLRRTTLAVTGRLTSDDIETIAGIVGAVLGWDAGETAGQTAGAEQVLRDRNLMRL
ncbi:glycerol-3-phosphate dehydrogenase [Jannaschia faecimaris]|uniref:Glycerol-3-phosphate dehydrogenase n=1 Tax=Jannaschia faecimaris TaxID=1244108 RepID=A0A1H3P4Y0_9RHOB|nr:glycerol-3-phosphate dehydrogenase/oxidase [Jannaschia faecimaris]SDY96204.1 glycerol-3-phosphate dehydrogenase [Jannaschia faecimaris]